MRARSALSTAVFCQSFASVYPSPVLWQSFFLWQSFVSFTPTSVLRQFSACTCAVCVGSAWDDTRCVAADNGSSFNSVFKVVMPSVPRILCHEWTRQ